MDGGEEEGVKRGVELSWRRMGGEAEGEEVKVKG